VATPAFRRIRSVANKCDLRPQPPRDRHVAGAGPWNSAVARPRGQGAVLSPRAAFPTKTHQNSYKVLLDGGLWWVSIHPHSANQWRRGLATPGRHRFVPVPVPHPRPAPASLSLCRWRAGGRCFWRRVGPRRGGRLASSRRVGRRGGMLWLPALRMRHVSRAMPFDPSARTGLTPMHPMPTTVAWTIGGRCRCGERRWCRIRVRTCWFGGRIRA
jgi:hypothetical protein